MDNDLHTTVKIGDFSILGRIRQLYISNLWSYSKFPYIGVAEKRVVRVIRFARFSASIRLSSAVCSIVWSNVGRVLPLWLNRTLQRCLYRLSQDITDLQCFSLNWSQRYRLSRYLERYIDTPLYWRKDILERYIDTPLYWRKDILERYIDTPLYLRPPSHGYDHTSK